MAGGGCRPDSVPRRAASIHLGRALPHGSSSQPGDLTHTRWDAGTDNPRPPYSALLRMGFTVPPPFPEGRCALTAPFHPYPRPTGGGLLSAALSLALPRPGVTRHAACRGVRTFLQDRGPSGRPPPPAAPSIPPVGEVDRYRPPTGRISDFEFRIFNPPTGFAVTNLLSKGVHHKEARSVLPVFVVQASRLHIPAWTKGVGLSADRRRR